MVWPTTIIISASHRTRDIKIIGELPIGKEDFSFIFFGKWILFQVKNFGIRGSFLSRKTWSKYLDKICLFKHKTIIQIGIMCNEIFCYLGDSACWWLINENAQIFRSHIKYIWIFSCEGNCRTLIGLWK